MITIRQATQQDVAGIVVIHCDAFKDFFLTSLGKRFLTTYYSCFIGSNETVTLCAEDDGKLIGFSAATSVSKGFNGRLIRGNAARFVLLGIKMLFISPSALIRLTKNFTKKSSEIEDIEEYGELYSIGVSSKCQGKGVGKILINSTESEIYKRNREVKRLSLTTDYYNNRSTIAFYQNCGYRILYDFITYPKRRMLRMIKNLE